MAEYRTVTVEAAITQQIFTANASVSDMVFSADASLAISVAYSPLPHYEGAYEVTPSAAVQTLATTRMVMDGDVRVNPIPSNYGLITWNGSVLTVS